MVTPEETLVNHGHARRDPQLCYHSRHWSTEFGTRFGEEGVDVVRLLGYLGCCSFYDVYMYIVLYVPYTNLFYRCGDMVLCGGLTYLAGCICAVGYVFPVMGLSG